MNSDAAKVEAQFAKILDGILKTKSAKALIRMVQKLPQVGGRPPRVTYVVGNHDRVLNNFPSLKQAIVAAFDPVSVTFTTELREPAYALLARHGHEWDDNCHGWKFLTKVLQHGSKVGQFDAAAYLTMAIGEAVTAELMSGIVYGVAHHANIDLADPADAEFVEQIKDVNNLRPMLDVFEWVNWFTQGRDKRYLRMAQDALSDALDGLLDCALAKRWDHLRPDLVVSGDLIDWLEKARKVLRKDGIKKLGKIAKSLEKISSLFSHGDSDDCSKGAEEEFADSANDDVRYIVYGHTHNARQNCVSAQLTGDLQLYVNTGTYLPLIERTHPGPGFSRLERLTLSFFYNTNEDTDGRAGPGPTADVWTGIRDKRYA